MGRGGSDLHDGGVKPDNIFYINERQLARKNMNINEPGGSNSSEGKHQPSTLTKEKRKPQAIKKVKNQNAPRSQVSKTKDPPSKLKNKQRKPRVTKKVTTKTDKPPVTNKLNMKVRVLVENLKLKIADLLVTKEKKKRGRPAKKKAESITEQLQQVTGSKEALARSKDLTRAHYKCFVQMKATRMI